MHQGHAFRLEISNYSNFVFLEPGHSQSVPKFARENFILKSVCRHHFFHRLGAPDPMVDVAVVKLGKRGSLVKRGDEVTPVEAILVADDEPGQCEEPRAHEQELRAQAEAAPTGALHCASLQR